MIKPLGVFGHGAEVDAPDWAAFRHLPSISDFSLATGRPEKWVLNVLTPTPQTPVREIMPGIVQRLHAAGLMNQIVGMFFSEEWYSRWKSGEFPVPGCDHRNPNDWIRGGEIIRDWISEQHRVMKQYLPFPIVWLDTFVNDDKSFGGTYYQPVPRHVDVLALEAYVSNHGTWASDVEPFLQHAVATRHEPIVLVIQGFQAVGDSLWGRGPTEDSLANTRRWLAHPRVISGWVFDWVSRGNGCVGLADLPNRAQIEAYIGAR